MGAHVSSGDGSPRFELLGEGIGCPEGSGIFGCWCAVQHVYLATEAADSVEDAIAEFAGSHLRFVACRLLTADRRRKWAGAGSRYFVLFWRSRVGICPLWHMRSRGGVLVNG